MPSSRQCAIGSITSPLYAQMQQLPLASKLITLVNKPNIATHICAIRLPIANFTEIPHCFGYLLPHQQYAKVVYIRRLLYI